MEALSSRHNMWWLAALPCDLLYLARMNGHTTVLKEPFTDLALGAR